MTNRYNTIVIGGGAAGLMCAATLAEKGIHTLLLEKMEKCGRKIRITGKGRCNITNNKQRDVFLSKVQGGREFITHSFDTFNNFDTINYFEEIGLRTVTEQGGRIYPKSGDAWDVVRALENQIKKCGGNIICHATVKELIIKDNNCEGVEVEIKGETREIYADNIVVATGGVTYPSTGSTGDGYRFAHNSGHRVIPVMPALVPFEVDYPFNSDMKGLILKNVNITLKIDDKEAKSESGEVEFFAFGVGGGGIYRLSRAAVEALYEDKIVDFIIDLKAGLSPNKLKGRIERELDSNRNLSYSELLRKLLPPKIINGVIDYIGIAPNRRVSSLNDSEIDKLISGLKQFQLPVLQERGFNEAVITVGGVSCDEVDNLSMTSTLIDNLYFAGEVLDIDADTGGYNLQLAFSTARIAALSIINK